MKAATICGGCLLFVPQYLENPVFMRLCGIWQDHIFAFFLLNNAPEWGRMFIKVVESGLKCIEVVRSGRFLG